MVCHFTDKKKRYKKLRIRYIEMDTPAQTTIQNEEMQKAYEQLMKRRAYSVKYMRKFREERREEYNAQRRAMYARKKNNKSDQ